MSFKLLCRLGFFLTLAVVTTLALMPVRETPITTGWDKLNHCLAFAVLLALLDNAYPKMSFWEKKVSALLLYGVLIEVLQIAISERHFSLLDIVADAAGLAIYSIIRRWLIHHMPFIRSEDFK